MKSYSPAEQLGYLEIQSKKFSPEVYRAYALYLQNVRKYLKGSTLKLVLNLLKERNKYQSIAADLKTQDFLKQNINKLIDKTNSLLTVEHLLDLSKQIDEELKLKKELAKNRLINSLKSEKEKTNEIEGSIELSISPPIENPESINQWLTPDFFEQGLGFEHEDSFYPEADTDKEIFEIEENTQDGNYDNQLINDENTESIPEDQDLNNTSNPKNSERDIFRSIFLMASEAISPNKNNQNKKKIIPRTEEVNTQDDSISDKSLMPSNPLDLSIWINSIENALKRRLLNLSHAINVELLRAGVLDALLPINLLEAISQGHIEPQYAEPNLLKIRIPMQNSLFDQGMDITCILLRPSEFEYENPVLRRCRTLLKDRRSILSKMVRQYRHWQNRSVEEEAEKLWWGKPPEN